MLHLDSRGSSNQLHDEWVLASCLRVLFLKYYPHDLLNCVNNLQRRDMSRSLAVIFSERARHASPLHKKPSLAMSSHATGLYQNRRKQDVFAEPPWRDSRRF